MNNIYVYNVRVDDCLAFGCDVGVGAAASEGLRV